MPNEFAAGSVIASSASGCFRTNVSREDKPRTKRMRKSERVRQRKRERERERERVSE